MEDLFWFWSSIFSFLHRKERPSFTFSLFMRFLFLGFIGYIFIYIILYDICSPYLGLWIIEFKFYSFLIFCAEESLLKSSIIHIHISDILLHFDGFCRMTMTQAFLFLGLSYSSPILVCAMSHLIPTFNFLLSLILRFLISKLSDLLVYIISSFLPRSPFAMYWMDLKIFAKIGVENK